LLAGRTPRANREGLTVEDLCDHFLNSKRPLVTSGEIASRTFDEYHATCKRLLGAFTNTRLVDDLRPDDFDKLRVDIAKQWGPVRLGNEIQKVRSVFKFGFEAALIDKPIRFGPEFKKPSARVLRKHRAARGERMLEADELRRLLDAAPAPLKAMILLGVNCGLGNHDIAMLPTAALDLGKAWLNFPRPKTGIARRCPLWPETVVALKEAEPARPAAKDADAAKLFFLTVRGRQWLVRGIANPVSVAARRLMKSVDIERDGLGFYTLRHVFRTIADGSGDQVATNHIMGHVDSSMAATYRERIDDLRLLAVVEHVRKWLWPEAAKAEAKAKPTVKPKAKATGEHLLGAMHEKHDAQHNSSNRQDPVVVRAHEFCKHGGHSCLSNWKAFDLVRRLSRFWRRSRRYPGGDDCGDRS
jgi:integrase